MSSLIYKAIKEYAQKNSVRLHMPGHKGKGCLTDNFNSSLDVTELDVIDNEEVRLQAEKNCAKIYNAKYLRFLSDGATSGILSAVFAVKSFGKKLIISRSSHKSVYNALRICGIEPIILDYKIKDGLILPPTAKDFSDELLNDKDVIGALLTYPDYYGNSFDIKEISKRLKEHGKIFIVDNSHGAHYYFCDWLTPAEKYSDVCINSAHKVLCSLNQGAYVICNNSLLIEKISEAINIFSTTSPSYPILGSVEYGINQIAGNIEGLKKLFMLTEKVKSEAEKHGLKSVKNSDPFKICIDFGGEGYDTKEVSAFLEKENIFAEMDDGRYVVFMLSSSTTLEDINALIKAIEKLKSSIQKTSKTKELSAEVKNNKVVPYLQAINGEYQLVSLKDSIGKVSADNVGLFPPCFPLVVAGEKITKEIFELFSRGNLFGVIDGKIKVLKGI